MIAGLVETARTLVRMQIIDGTMQARRGSENTDLSAEVPAAVGEMRAKLEGELKASASGEPGKRQDEEG